MFKNYLKSALRNIMRHKGYSFISIAGLALGMAVFIIIAFFVQYEFSFDKFNENYDRVYRVEEFYKSNRAYGQYPITPAPLGAALQKNYPEIVNYTRIAGLGRRLISTMKGDKKLYRRDGRYADNSLFDIFSINMIKGNPEKALIDPFSMVLTEELAAALFPEEEPIGKTIRIHDQCDCKVTGIVKKMPKNSHFKFGYLVSLNSLQGDGRALADWNEDTVYSYVLMQKNHSFSDINKKIRDVLIKNRTGDRKTDKVELYLKPLAQVHHSNTNYELESAIPIEMTYVILAIGILILLISCINFINLSTAYSTNRGKEVGVRKVLGAARFSLIKQYLSESVLFSFISFALAWVLAEVSLPEFNRLLNTNVETNFIEQWPFILGLLGFAILIGIFSGSYPAFLLSSFHPVKVLKGKLTTGAKSPVLRKVLVTAQFFLCIVFIILSIVFFRQGKYIENLDKGFAEENILLQFFDNLSDEPIDQFIVLKEELLKNRDIKSAAVSMNLPYAIYHDKKVNWEGSSADEHIWITYTYVDDDFFETFDIKMKQGRKFSKEYATDRENACIINEKAASMMGWDSSAIGKRIGDNNYQVIGVVKDFCSSDMRLGIKPLMLLPYRDNRVGGFYFSIKFAPGTYSQSLAFVKQKFAEIIPDEAFEFRLFSHILAEMYNKFDNWNKLTASFAILSIILAALGLYAMASFTTQRRTKEIGIRKVIGASVAKILSLLLKEFFKILAIATLIAWPIAYLVMSTFLQQFAFRTNMQVWMFILSGVVVFITAAVTICYHTIKAALTNPVEALRYE